MAALAAVGFYSSWSVIEQNISAFADKNATASLALQMMADHMEWVAPAAPARPHLLENARQREAPIGPHTQNPRDVPPPNRATAARHACLQVASLLLPPYS